MEANLRVLHLDIDADATEAVRKLLAAGTGCKIDRVERLAEFQQAVDSHDYDLILSAWTLPDADAMEALRLVCQAPACPPLFSLLEMLDPERAVDAIKAGADDVVLKTHLDRLGPAIEQAFEARRPKPAPPKPENLAEADRRKDEFLAMLAHELRNPLAPVRNAVQVLRLTGAQTNPSPAPAATSSTARSRTWPACSTTCSTSRRITRGKIELQKQPLDLADVLAHAVETATPLIEAAPPHARRGRCRPMTCASRATWTAWPRSSATCWPTPPSTPRRAARSGWRRRREDERGGHPRARHGHGHRPGDAAAHLRPVRPGRPVAGDRSQGGLGIGLTLVKQPGRDARRHASRPTARGWARAASSSSACRPCPARARIAQAGEHAPDPTPPESPRAASWWWTTWWTRPRAWPNCCACGATRCATAHDGPAALEVGARVPARGGAAGYRHAGDGRLSRWPASCAEMEHAPTCCWWP